MPTLELRGAYPAQHDFISDLNPGHVLFQGGLGSGKSAAGARKAVLLHALNNQSWGACYAPTFSDIGRYIIPNIQQVCKENGIECEHFNRSKQFDFNHLLLFGRPIVLVSAEAVTSISGYECAWSWADEAARIQDHPNPVLNPWIQMGARNRHNKAKLRQFFYTSTSEGTGTALYKRFFSEKRPDHRVYIGKTTDNPWVTHQQLSDYLSNIPESLIPAYLNGETVDYTQDRCFPNFGKENIKEFVYEEGGTWRIGCDFNIDNMSWTLAYQKGEIIHVVEEHIIEKDAQVEVMVKQIAERNWLNRQPLHIHGDRSGGRNRQTGLTDQITTVNAIQSRGVYVVPHFLSGANPPVRDRINIMNTRIKNAEGVRRFFVDPSCKNLIKQFHSVARDANGAYAKDKLRDPHALESISYSVVDIYKPFGKVGIVANTLYS